MPDTNCKFSSGDVAKVDDDARLQAGGKDCTFEKGAVILLSYDAPETPAPTQVKEVSMNPVMSAPPAPESHPSPAPVPEAAPAVETPAVEHHDAPVAAAPAELQAHTEVPSSPSADDMTKIMETAGGNPALALGMAALVVVGGGGAMWKFIQQRGKASAELDAKRAEQDHELKLKELEIKASQSQGHDYSTTQPPPCQAAAVKQEATLASLRAELEEVKAKVSKVERKSMSISADFDAEELVERLEKAEKDLKSLKAAKRTKA